MAVGRKPNIDRKHLDDIGVKTTKRGILVDERMQTSAKTVWAAGDAVDPHLLANVAIREAKVAVAYACMLVDEKPQVLKRVNFVFLRGSMTPAKFAS